MLNVLPPHGGSGEGVWILIMKYIKPNMEVKDASAIEMLAASLPIGEGTVDGGDALTKENKWDIFSDEDTTEE